jgi:thymidylate synthase
MHLFYRDINDAFAGIVEGFYQSRFVMQAPPGFTTIKSRVYLEPPMTTSPSRYGQVITIEEPVIITYQNPLNRVLFNSYRDCNPFFHLIEALWMLAGRNDVKTLTHFVKSFAKFSDDGETIHDAYGYRWRHHFPDPDYGLPDEVTGRYLAIDQIREAISILKADPFTRRVVLAMWDASDLHRVRTMPDCKAVPCNLHVMFRPRHSEQASIGGADHTLDMTVTNRSNDMLLGALGANYVHMSFLHEYIALATGFRVGLYHHITNNLHVYTQKVPATDIMPTFPPTPPKENGTVWSPGGWVPPKLLNANFEHSYQDYNHYTPLYEDREAFDREIALLLDEVADDKLPSTSYINNSLNDLFIPAMRAHWFHRRERPIEAMRAATFIIPPDWRTACCQWLTRRRKEVSHATPTV